MSELIVRDLEDDLRDKLQDLAQKQGRSVEETVHDLLRQGVESPSEPRKGLGTLFIEQFSGKGIGLEQEIPELRGQTIQPPSFDA